MPLDYFMACHIHVDEFKQTYSYSFICTFFQKPFILKVPSVTSISRLCKNMCGFENLFYE